MNVEKKAMVLIVDDQPIIIQTLYAILKHTYEVCMATNGAEAIEFCSRRLPDLVLLDIEMDGMNGYEVCQRLKADEATQDIPIIFSTGYDDAEAEARGLDVGAVDFISKPVHAKVVLARVRTHLTIKAQREQLQSLVLIDGLTGVANRRRFDAALAVEWKHCRRLAASLAVILIDIDFFKRFNDRYGHQAGDACIQAVASAIQSGLRRPHDLVARYGGEEFVCVLPDTSLAGAYQKALEFESDVRKLRIAHDQSDLTDIVTISVGVAAVIPAEGNSPEELIAAADRELYRAKQSGRGQVQCDAKN